jgi:hypothetical protein
MEHLDQITSSVLRVGDGRGFVAQWQQRLMRSAHSRDQLGKRSPTSSMAEARETTAMTVIWT